MAIPTLATSNSLGEQITVCVDWNTKQVTYSKFWERCPSKTTPVQLGAVGPAGPQGEVGPQGPAGPAGARGPRGAEGTSSDNSYPWGSQGSCYQKLQAALNSGYRMMYRDERETFEADTGCVVEEIRDEQTISQVREAGLPVITDWEFVGNGSAGGGGRGGFAYESLFKVTIANHDSGSGPLFGFCGVGVNGNSLTHLGNGEYLGGFSTWADFEGGLTTELEIGYATRGGGCSRFRAPLFAGLYLRVYEDPTTINERLQSHESDHYLEAYAELYELWGW